MDGPFNNLLTFNLFYLHSHNGISTSITHWSFNGSAQISESEKKTILHILETVCDVGPYALD